MYNFILISLLNDDNHVGYNHADQSPKSEKFLKLHIDQVLKVLITRDIFTQVY